MPATAAPAKDPPSSPAGASAAERDRQKLYRDLAQELFERAAEKRDPLVGQSFELQADQLRVKIPASKPGGAPPTSTEGRTEQRRDFPRHGRIRVTATKSQLDQVGKGDISFADFSAAVQVESYQGNPSR
jgi:hypothetical protein